MGKESVMRQRIQQRTPFKFSSVPRFIGKPSTIKQDEHPQINLNNKVVEAKVNQLLRQDDQEIEESK